MNIHIKNVLAVLSKNGVYKSEKTDIYTKGNTVLAIGTAPDGYKADKIIDGESKLAIPGLVNCHSHVYMSLFRNLADDLSFEDWLFKNVMPMEDKMNETDAYWGAMLGYAEMLKTGTTSVLDMNMFSTECAKAVDNIGIRATLSRGLVGFGKNDESGIARINELKNTMSQYKDHSRFGFMIAPHAIYTTDREYLELCIETAKELDLSIHIHVSETRNEVNTSIEKYKKSPVEYLNEIGIFDVNTVAAHCVHLSERDIEILTEKKVNIAANPKSNLKLANGVAPIPRLIEKGINVCLGTDSAASNNSLNLISEMNYNALLHKGITGNPQTVTANETFKIATENGAKALKINSGCLEVGKKADIVLIDLNRPQFIPSCDPVTALVYSANGSEVETVIVDGEVVLEKGRLTKIDEKELYAKANSAFENLKKRI